MIQHRECGVRLKYRADPEDTEGAGSDHGAYRRVERMTAAAQDARWDLIQIADRLKEQDAQDAHGGVLDHGGLRCEQAGESITEQDDRKNRDRAAKRRQPNMGGFCHHGHGQARDGRRHPAGYDPAAHPLPA